MLSTKTIFTYIIFAIICVIAYFSWSSEEKRYSQVTSFKECVTAGYPILLTYPETCKTPDRRTFTNETQVVATTTKVVAATSTQKDNLIVIDNMINNQEVSSPLEIKGRARGFWYFEASFPVELRDANGKQLAIKPAQAIGNWMTEDFVPFAITLTYSKPTTATGTLIFHKDNPSGGVGRDDSLSIPVTFVEKKRTVEIYHYNSALDKDNKGTILCSAQGLVKVTRDIPITLSPIQDTLTLFLNGGVTAEEKRQGLTTKFPLQNVTLKSAVLSKTGVLTITLDDPLSKTSGGACAAGILRAQLEATAKQFKEVKSVVIKPESLFQP